MLAKRVIPCLDCDYREGKVVVLKGRKFGRLRYAGEPVELAENYQEADELVMLDIGATLKERETFLKSVSEVASACSIPLCVGGGIRSLADFEARIKSGADQCSINTAALRNPSLIAQCAGEFGSQAVVVAVDARLENGKYCCYEAAGSAKTCWGLSRWMSEAQGRGAGEILLTSIDRDGAREGYDVPMLAEAGKAVSIPIIASGGCSSVQDMVEVFGKIRV